ncbi:ABC transporter ATP-binding protein [Rothia amarae]|uniref:ABC transporter ATP-binding protein n=1 Tax=Rothia amarae TaxID=169480 RepID=UPI0011A020FD
MKNETALSVHQVSKTFTTRGGTVHAIQNASFSIGSGEIVALLGENGAGKSTLIDIILGISDPNEGTVSLFEEERSTAIQQGKVGAILQTGGLLKTLKAKDQIEMVAATYPHKVNVEAAMEVAGVTEFAQRKIEKCSGGQQQKIKFAIALLAQPQLLILDEPTTGMDVNARQDFWTAMQQLARQGTTIIFATHYLEEAQEFAERIIIMGAGKVLADQSTTSLQNASGTSRISFDMKQSEQEKLLAELSQDYSVFDIESHAKTISLSSQNPEDVARYLLNNYEISNLEIHKPSVEQIFKELTHNSLAAI